MRRKHFWKTTVLVLIIPAFICMAASALFRKPDAQSRSDKQREGPEVLFKIVRNHKTGYIDRTGKIAIEPRFDGNTEEFSEGLARISINTDGIPHHVKFGFIDTTGKVAI